MSLSAKIKAIPPVTRFFTVGTIMMGFAIRLGYVLPEDLRCTPAQFIGPLYDIKMEWQHGKITGIILSVLRLVKECHRFFSSFMVLSTKPFLSFAMLVYFFYDFAKHLESPRGKFHSIFPDVLWFTLICGTIIHIVNFTVWYVEYNYNVLDFFMYVPIAYTPFRSMFSCVIFIWSRCLKNSTINFMGILPLEGVYLPLFEAAADFLMGAPLGDLLVGFLAGYLYLCLQSRTIPVYNLLPGSYSYYNSLLAGRDQRVGVTSSTMSPITHHHDSIWDLGYLKAPVWLYSVLKYPRNPYRSVSAFEQINGGKRSSFSIRDTMVVNTPSSKSKQTPHDDDSTYQSTKSLSDSWFKGTGHKLGS